MTARIAAALAALGWLCAPASAFRPEPSQAGDAKRFGLDRPEPAAPRRPAAAGAQAAARFNALSSQGAKIRFSPQSGAVSSVSGPLTPPRTGSPEELAASFLRENRELLGIDPSELRLVTFREEGGRRHLLFRQVHAGLPVEFSRVKVHLSERGEVISFQSNHVAGISASETPRVGVSEAAAAAGRDLGAASPSGGSLVFLPVYKTGETRLAWKFKISGGRGVWYYYIDAETGEVLFRYNDLRFQCASGTSGTVLGEVFDVDPSSSGPNPAIRGMPNQKVYVYSASVSTFAVTGPGGAFCSPGTAGKIFTSLQGTRANVAHYTKLSAHHDNGGGQWFTAATPLSSPHPYPNSSVFPNSAVFIGTINAVAPPTPPFAGGSVAVKLLPNFSFFQVGTQTPDGDIGDDDQVQLLDSDGHPIASYIGTRSSFKGAAVQGCLACEQAAGRAPMRVRLTANQSGQQLGFDINVSSYMVLTDAPTVAVLPSNLTWVSTHTADSTRDELNVYYHLNQMHDYFMTDVNRSTLAYISDPVVAMTHFGPDLANAFYNPDHNNLGFGDVGGGIALDATVVRHEYVHYVVDKIFPTINFGQHGAISEAMADYFAASSLNVPAIGRFVAGSFGAESALRELACVPGSTPSCRRFPEHWSGEIHDDALPLTQALWEIRSDLINVRGAALGRSCADGLVFRALFFYPDSFQEFLDAMLLVDAAGSVSACGGASTQRALIQNRFSNHLVTNVAAGASEFEPNDGTQSAADISTQAVITAKIFPVADIDYYTFGAAPGRITARLSLPRATEASHYAYSLTLVDRNLNVLQEVNPPLDVNPTLNGLCPNLDCQTSASEVLLVYDNPTPNQFYLQVAGALGDNFSNSGTNSTLPYTLRVERSQAGALEGSIVSAVFDNDKIDFTAVVSSFAAQNIVFSHAQLRDHAFNVLSRTQTNGVSPLLALDGAVTSALGRISGSLRLQPGFAARYPAVGTVYLELFGLNALQSAKGADGDPATVSTPQSLGLSPGLNLTATSAKLTAFNNIFTPARGEKATFKFETTGAGHVRLRLFTQSGALVSTLIDSDLPAGKGSVDWNGRNPAGTTVASGIYLLNLQAPGVNVTQKVIVVK